MCKPFDWAKFIQTKGEIKLHLPLEYEGYLAVFVDLQIYFVTRQKDNADYKVIEERQRPKNRNINHISHIQGEVADRNIL